MAFINARLCAGVPRPGTMSLAISGRCRHYANRLHICCLVLLFFLSTAQGAEQAGSLFMHVYTGPRSLDGSPSSEAGATPVDTTADVARALLDQAGIEHELTVIPWSRAVQALQSTPNVMVYSMIRNNEREHLYEWIGMIRPVETWLFALDGKLQQLPATLDQARNYSIGLARRSAADDYLQSLGFTDIAYMGDASRAPLLLQRNRIDLAAFTLNESMGMQERFDLQPGELIPVIKLEPLSTGTYFVVSKQTDPALVTRLKQAYQDLVDNGRYVQIMGLQD